MTFGRIRDDTGESGFARSRRTIEDNRCEQVSLYRASQESSFADYVLLSDVFIYRAGSHPCGERLDALVHCSREKVVIFTVRHQNSPPERRLLRCMTSLSDNVLK